MDQPRFNIILLEDARNFLKNLPQTAKEEVLSDMKASTHVVNTTLFKKLVGTNIWEFRTKAGGMQYRMLAFWDKTQKAMVIATHGFVKKTQKTPPQEIKKAEQIMKRYYELKNKN